MRIDTGNGWEPFSGEIPPMGRVEITGDADGDGVLVLVNGKIGAARTAPFFSASTFLEHAMVIREAGEEGRPLHGDEAALTDRHSDAVAAVLDDHALAALRFLEALHSGDAGFFRAVADALRDRKKRGHALKVIDDVAAMIHAGDDSGLSSAAYRQACLELEVEAGKDIEAEILKWAVFAASRKCGGVPTVELVAASYESISVPRFPGLEYTEDPRGRDRIKAQKLPRRTIKDEKWRNGRKEIKARRLERFKERLQDEGWGWLPHRKRGDTLRQK